MLDPNPRITSWRGGGAGAEPRPWRQPEPAAAATTSWCSTTRHDVHKEALVPRGDAATSLQHSSGPIIWRMSAQFDEESMISNGSRSCNRLLLLPPRPARGRPRNGWRAMLDTPTSSGVEQSRGNPGPQRGDTLHPTGVLQRRTHSVISVFL
ncbi:hypothetical protein FQN60_014688, partial [Etheostoma spectabile]